jgi:hypothetical protein
VKVTDIKSNLVSHVIPRPRRQAGGLGIPPRVDRPVPEDNES